MLLFTSEKDPFLKSVILRNMLLIEHVFLVVAGEDSYALADKASVFAGGVRSHASDWMTFAYWEQTRAPCETKGSLVPDNSS